MANSVTPHVIKAVDSQPDGTKVGRYVVKTILTTDGTGEFSAQIINAVTGDMGTSNKLLRVQGHLPGYSGHLLWDATSDVKLISLPKDRDFDFCFETHPIPNNAGTGITGDILFTSAGAATVTGTGFIILEVMRNS